MRLPYAAGPDEGDVAVRVEVGQRRELAQRGRVPALDPGEVEALEGLGSCRSSCLSFTSMFLLTPACWHHQRSGGGEARWPLFGDRDWSK